MQSARNAAKGAPEKEKTQVEATWRNGEKSAAVDAGLPSGTHCENRHVQTGLINRLRQLGGMLRVALRHL
jgi:hypothetical protein